MREATDDQNNITVTKIAKVADVSQDWRAYNAPQNSGTKLFDALLKDLETWKNSHKRWENRDCTLSKKVYSARYRRSTLIRALVAKPLLGVHNNFILAKQKLYLRKNPIHQAYPTILSSL
jgi:hypothetical protein